MPAALAPFGTSGRGVPRAVRGAAGEAARPEGPGAMMAGVDRAAAGAGGMGYGDGGCSAVANGVSAVANGVTAVPAAANGVTAVANGSSAVATGGGDGGGANAADAKADADGAGAGEGGGAGAGAGGAGGAGGGQALAGQRAAPPLDAGAQDAGKLQHGADGRGRHGEAGSDAQPCAATAERGPPSERAPRALFSPFAYEEQVKPRVLPKPDALSLTDAEVDRMLAEPAAIQVDKLKSPFLEIFVDALVRSIESPATVLNSARAHAGTSVFASQLKTVAAMAKAVTAMHSHDKLLPVNVRARAKRLLGGTLVDVPRLPASEQSAIAASMLTPGAVGGKECDTSLQAAQAAADAKEDVCQAVKDERSKRRKRSTNCPSISAPAPRAGETAETCEQRRCARIDANRQASAQRTRRMADVRNTLSDSCRLMHRDKGFLEDELAWLKAKHEALKARNAAAEAGIAEAQRIKQSGTNRSQGEVAAELELRVGDLPEVVPVPAPPAHVIGAAIMGMAMPGVDDGGERPGPATHGERRRPSDGSGVAAAAGDPSGAAIENPNGAAAGTSAGDRSEQAKGGDATGAGGESAQARGSPTVIGVDMAALKAKEDAMDGVTEQEQRAQCVSIMRRVLTEYPKVLIYTLLATAAQEGTAAGKIEAEEGAAGASAAAPERAFAQAQAMGDAEKLSLAESQMGAHMDKQMFRERLFRQQQRRAQAQAVQPCFEQQRKCVVPTSEDMKTLLTSLQATSEPLNPQFLMAQQTVRHQEHLTRQEAQLAQQQTQLAQSQAALASQLAQGGQLAQGSSEQTDPVSFAQDQLAQAQMQLRLARLQQQTQQAQLQHAQLQQSPPRLQQQQLLQLQYAQLEQAQQQLQLQQQQQTQQQQQQVQLLQQQLLLRQQQQQQQQQKQLLEQQLLQQLQQQQPQPQPHQQPKGQLQPLALPQEMALLQKAQVLARHSSQGQETGQRTAQPMMNQLETSPGRLVASQVHPGGQPHVSMGFDVVSALQRAQLRQQQLQEQQLQLDAQAQAQAQQAALLEAGNLNPSLALANALAKRRSDGVGC